MKSAHKVKVLITLQPREDKANALNGMPELLQLVHFLNRCGRNFRPMTEYYPLLCKKRNLLLLLVSYSYELAHKTLKI